jgi:hypothetical protein
MLSTPNTGHWQALREPDAWPGYRPPSHLLGFDVHTLTDTLQRVGFEHIDVRGISPLPPLPGWLRTASAPLQRALANGHAKPWQAARLLWLAIRVGGWGWARIVHRLDDIFATLEATARRPP